jgi:hypothetical protein
MEREGRILHRDWERYDTAHVVFRPKLMTEKQLLDGYARCYRKMFSLRSIWRRRPQRTSEVLPYMGMSVLYKKANWLWPWLIRYRLTHAFWLPLVELSRQRHLRFRKKLIESERVEGAFGAPVSAGV